MGYLYLLQRYNDTDTESDRVVAYEYSLEDDDVALPGGLREVVQRSALVDGGQQQVTDDGRRRHVHGRLTVAVHGRHVGTLPHQQLHDLQQRSRTHTRPRSVRWSGDKLIASDNWLDTSSYSTYGAGSRRQLAKTWLASDTAGLSHFDYRLHKLLKRVKKVAGTRLPSVGFRS